MLIQDECWVITDGAAGNQRQALALAQRLQRPIRQLDLSARPPWSWLAPRFLPAALLALPAAQRQLWTTSKDKQHWPSVAIGCGRIGAYYTRLLGRLSAGRCFTVQILDPRLDPGHWDLVIAPRHDGLHGANVIQPLGSLNPIDDTWLAQGRRDFPALGQLPGPRRGVLLGGPRQGVALDRPYTAKLIKQLLARQQHDGGSTLVVASRRTPPALADTLRAALLDQPGLHWSGPGDGANPYAGVLGWADHLVVTPDSVNMLSEACAVGCTVSTQVTAPLPRKLAAFHAALRADGRLHALIDLTAPSRQTPLRETAGIAAKLLPCLATRR